MKKILVFVRNVLNRFSERGLLDFILLSTKRVLKKVIELDILIVTTKDLSMPVERVNTPLDITHEFIDINRLEEIIGGKYAFEREDMFKNIDEIYKAVRQRLLDKKTVCISLVNDKIIGWKWIDFELYSIPENNIKIKLSNKHVHIFDVYTIPSYRGKRIQPSASEYVFRTLKAQGIISCLGCVSFENLSSIKTQKKSGWNELGYIYYVGFKKKRVYFLSRRLRSKPEFRQATAS